VARFSQFNFDITMVLDRNEEEAIAYLASMTEIIVLLGRALIFGGWQGGDRQPRFEVLSIPG
jgi:hypothetical protein